MRPRGEAGEGFRRDLLHDGANRVGHVGSEVVRHLDHFQRVVAGGGEDLGAESHRVLDGMEPLEHRERRVAAGRPEPSRRLLHP